MLSFLGGETVALGVIWWIVGLAALCGILRDVIIRARPRYAARQRGDRRGRVDDGSSTRAGLLYLLCLWGVLWCACLAASVLGETEANWMVPGYIVARGADRRRESTGYSQRRPESPRGTSPPGAFCDRGGRRSITRSGSIPRSPLGPCPVQRWAAPFRLYEPTARLRGHQEVARAVAAKVRALAGRVSRRSS